MALPQSPLRRVPHVFILVLGACQGGGDDDTATPAPNPLDVVAPTADYTLPCLEGPAHVVRTEHDFPHIYAATREDLFCAQAFVTARDRFFSMDLGRRLGQGRISEFLGEQGLETDVENRSIGMRLVADRIWESLNEEERRAFESYAAGVNAYIELVRAGTFLPPPELELAYGLLGAAAPIDLMTDWEGRDVAGMAATLVYELGFETTDIGSQSGLDAFEDWGHTLPDADLRRTAAIEDVAGRLAPIFPIDSSAGFQPASARGASAHGLDAVRQAPKVERGALNRAAARGARIDRRLGRRDEEEFGSNAWAVAPSMTADGVAMVASDGHLPLTVPPLFYNVHLDTELLGGGEDHAIGLSLPGVPMVVLGTNGHVGWGQTQLGNDINDWYRDEIVVGADGRPTATRFAAGEQAIVEIVEDYYVSSALGSKEGTRTISRWETADGRLFLSMEGVEVGEADDGAVNVGGTWLRLEDVDGDGVITGVSGAYTGWEERYLMRHVQAFGEARNVDDFALAHSGMAAYSQSLIVADTGGNILFSSYEAFACRGYLPRDNDGVPLPGANPLYLIDGTTYPSFQVRHDAAGRIDPAPDDELSCMLSYEQHPHSKNPEQGFVLTANNAPYSAPFDDNLWNDPIYVGGPWTAGHRAERIREQLVAGAGTHTVESMSALQGNHTSMSGQMHLSHLLDALDAAGDASKAGVTEGALGRAAAVWTAHEAAITEARSRLEGWRDAGFNAASGVQTFYDTPTPEDVEDAVATMIWNAFQGRFWAAVWDDEGLPSIWPKGGSRESKARVLEDMLLGRGPGNASAQAGWNPATEEHVFFDNVATPEVESSTEVLVQAFADALDYLATTPGADRSGGFGTAEQDRWLWGLKHFVTFDSILSEFLGDDPTFSSVAEQFAITSEVLPLDDPAPAVGDPRRGLPGYPRPGDAFCVDAAGGPGHSGFGYGSGPVMRFVAALDPSGVRGVHVLPGGQSAFPDSPHFADQAALWLGNETFPLRFYVDDVVAAATGREILHP